MMSCSCRVQVVQCRLQSSHDGDRRRKKQHKKREEVKLGVGSLQRDNETRPTPASTSDKYSPVAAPTRVLGILGGGQLGQMLTTEAVKMGVEVVVVDPNEQNKAPAALAGASHIVGSFRSRDSILTLASHVDVITVEVEHVNCDALQEAVDKRGSEIEVNPSIDTLRLLQDKYLQKRHLSSAGVPVLEFMEVRERGHRSVENAIREFGTPLLLKRKKLSYDGRGNYTIPYIEAEGESNEEIIAEAVNALGGFGKTGDALYTEKYVNFSKELAVMVVRGPPTIGMNDSISMSSSSSTSKDACLYAYPVVETIHENHICKHVIAPADISQSIKDEATAIAMQAVESLEGYGVFGVELFLVMNNENDFGIYVNEIAPRPHNSGHYSIESCFCNQYENHIRAVMGWPIGDCNMIQGGMEKGNPKSDGAFNHEIGTVHAQMVNIIGKSDDAVLGSLLSSIEYSNAMLDTRTHVHWYGKSPRKGRKLGHYTVVGNGGSGSGSVKERVEIIQSKVDIQEQEILKMWNDYDSNSSSSRSENRNKRSERIPIGISPKALSNQYQNGQESKDASPVSSSMSESVSVPVSPEVCIIMGSDSDLPTMRPAAELLEDYFGISVELTVVSAHRTPQRMFAYARECAARGVRVIIAGAGGAAHLPGMVASLTPLPVIGVPIVPSSSGSGSGNMSSLGGMDALLSIVQMPKGVPVATVAIGNAVNGALLAARILGCGCDTDSPRTVHIRQMMEQYQHEMEETVMGKVKKLDHDGYRTY